MKQPRNHPVEKGLFVKCCDVQISEYLSNQRAPNIQSMLGNPKEYDDPVVTFTLDCPSLSC